MPKSYELLDNVARVVNDHSEIDRIFIQGHSDSDGDDDYNLALSDKRAKSVMRYLTDNGQVDAARLKAKGYGESKPIAENTSEEGKQTNRRVEFLIDDDNARDQGAEGADQSGKKRKAQSAAESADVLP